MAAKNVINKTVACVGLALCLVYVAASVICAINYSGMEIESLGGNSDYMRLMGWSWDEVSWSKVLLVALFAVSVAFPWIWYFRDMWVTGRYRFWIFDVKSVTGKMWSILYVVLNILVLFTHAGLAEIPEPDPENGEYFLMDKMYPILMLITFYPLYLCATTVGCLWRRKRRVKPD